MRTAALLARFSCIDGLHGIQEKVLQLECLDQFRIPNETPTGQLERSKGKARPSPDRVGAPH